MRTKLQKEGNQESAKRLLRKPSGRERRLARDVKPLYQQGHMQHGARHPQHGIALENLQGIRNRAGQTVPPKRQRRVLHSWAFFQLRSFIAYKAAVGWCARGPGEPCLHEPDLQPLWAL